ncbi:hypothetical protein MRX96_026658 [Rhipicephalus microplus]
MWKAFHFINSCDQPLYGKHSEPDKGPIIEDDGETLPTAFKAVLEAYPIVPSSVVKRLLIVTYSPVQCHTASKERYALQLLDELARCRLWKVPLYAISLGGSGGSYKRNRFLADVCEEGDSCSSPSSVSSLCLRAETQAFEIKRLSIGQVAEWVERNTDIAESVRVIHLVRDPREIYGQSRFRLVQGQ